MIRDALLPEFDQEMANTRKTLERCPEDKFGWRPHPKSFSMGALATHIANMTGWAVDVIEKDALDIAPPGAPPYTEEPAASRQELLAKFDKNASAARAADAFLSNFASSSCREAAGSSVYGGAPGGAMSSASFSMTSTAQPVMFAICVASAPMLKDFGCGLQPNLSSGQRSNVLRVLAIS